MKILYDFRAFQLFYQRGVSRYVFDMFESAIRQSEDPAFVLLYKDRVFPKFSPNVERKVTYCFEHDFSMDSYRYYEFDAFINGSCHWLDVPAKEAVQKLYPPAVMRCCRIKCSVIHDFIPLFFQQYIASEDQRISFSLQSEALKCLDHFFTNSMFTLASGVRYLDRPAADFTCLYGGANVQKFTTPNSSKPYDAKLRRNHLVYVSGAAPQKNSEGFARAFCKAYRRGLTPKDAKLYIVCAAPQSFKAAIRMEAETVGCQYGKQVEATGFIPDERMIDLLTSARSSIFPSFYEGLGLPILESYVAGTPCWASGVSATKEITLPECAFDPFDEESMIAAVAEIYQNPELCKRSLEYGRKHIKKFNWDTGARKMLDKLRELVSAEYEKSNCKIS